jgi:hypothetical protein
MAAKLVGLDYLLKDRVSNVDEFRRFADGGTAIDPEVITQLSAAIALGITEKPSANTSTTFSPSWTCRPPTTTA